MPREKMHFFLYSIQRQKLLQIQVVVLSAHAFMSVCVHRRVTARSLASQPKTPHMLHWNAPAQLNPFRG